MLILLAHGALGWYDDLIFLGIIVIFLGMMFISWFRSRGEDYEQTDLMPESSDSVHHESAERFQLD